MNFYSFLVYFSVWFRNSEFLRPIVSNTKELDFAIFLNEPDHHLNFFHVTS